MLPRHSAGLICLLTKQLFIQNCQFHCFSLPKFCSRFFEYARPHNSINLAGFALICQIVDSWNVLIAFICFSSSFVGVWISMFQLHLIRPFALVIDFQVSCAVHSLPPSTRIVCVRPAFFALCVSKACFLFSLAISFLISILLHSIGGSFVQKFSSFCLGRLSLLSPFFSRWRCLHFSRHFQPDHPNGRIMQNTRTNTFLKDFPLCLLEGFRRRLTYLNFFCLFCLLKRISSLRFSRVCGFRLTIKCVRFVGTKSSQRFVFCLFLQQPLKFSILNQDSWFFTFHNFANFLWPVLTFYNLSFPPSPTLSFSQSKCNTQQSLFLGHHFVIQFCVTCIACICFNRLVMTFLKLTIFTLCGY